MLFQKGWCLIYTKPNHEKKVAKCLSECGVTCYLPLVRSLRTWHDRKKYIDTPLFPSYIFVYLTTLYDYYHCQSCDGFLYFVSSGKKLAVVSDSIVNNIRIAVENGREMEVSTGSFQPGNRLTVVSGPLAGLSGEMVQFKEKERILIRVNLLQRNILIAVPSENLILTNKTSLSQSS